MTKCKRCGATTWDSQLWNSDTILTEFNGKWLCKTCREGSPIAIMDKPLTKEANEKPVKHSASSSMMFPLLSIALLVSMVVVLYPAVTALNDASALAHSSAFQGVYANAVMQLCGELVLFGFLGIVLFQLHEKHII